MRFTRRSFIFVFALLLSCAFPLQALAAPNLLLTPQGVTYQGGGVYRCVVRITNRGTSSSGATDTLKLYANGTLYGTYTLSGGNAVRAGDYEDFYADYNLGGASSAVVRVEVASSLSHYPEQSVTAHIPSDAGPVGDGDSGGGGGCDAGALGMGALGLAAALTMRNRRRSK